MKIEEVKISLQKALVEEKFIKGTFSVPLEKTEELEKFSVKPVILKNEKVYQIEQFINKKAHHKNLDADTAYEFIIENMEKFKNLNIFLKDEEYSIINNNGKFHIKTKKIQKEIKIAEHNRKKEYIISDEKPIEFLIDLGIMDKMGKIIPGSYSKFKQINRYLEFIRDVIDELEDKKLLEDTLKVVDFGSGKSYLTFVLYYYLKVLRGINVEVIGLDLKKDVMKHCGELAKKYGFDNMEFLYGDIKDFEKLKKVDIVFSLHACNNATDYAILKGLELEAKVIMAVPCCHKEFNQKITKSKKTMLKQELVPIVEHGILLEKFSALITEGFRANILQLSGYDTTVMEFIDTEHTPKNILIKAIKSVKLSEDLKKKKENTENLIEFLGVQPILYDLAKKYFKI
ncbi:MAG: class I SAM-dependent methyltransferase [Fusobacteriaceae bacterium]